MKQRNLSLTLLLTEGHGSTLWPSVPPYGWRPKKRNSFFQKIYSEPDHDFFMIGNGRRAYNSKLMRFVQPDTLSPFKSGGINSYCYCLNDPINRHDPSGQFSLGWLDSVGLAFQRLTPRNRSTPAKIGTSGKNSAGALLQILQFTLSALEKTLIGSPLTNNRLHMLKRETAEFASQKGKQSAISITHQNIVNSMPINTLHKFVMSDSGLIHAAPWTRENYFTHAALANIMGVKSVASSGYIVRTHLNSVSITQRSGHFQPSLERMARPALTLGSFGAVVKVIDDNSVAASVKATRTA